MLKAHESSRRKGYHKDSSMMAILSFQLHSIPLLTSLLLPNLPLSVLGVRHKAYTGMRRKWKGILFFIWDHTAPYKSASSARPE